MRFEGLRAVEMSMLKATISFVFLTKKKKTIRLGEMRNACRILVGKPEGKRSLARHRHV
jgi:hypothetical protein